MKIRSFGTLASAALVSIGMCGGAMARSGGCSLRAFLSCQGASFIAP